MFKYPFFVTNELTEEIPDIFIKAAVERIESRKNEKLSDLQIFILKKLDNYKVKILNHDENMGNSFSSMIVDLSDNHEDYNKLKDDNMFIALSTDEGSVIMTEDDYKHFEDKYKVNDKQ